MSHQPRSQRKPPAPAQDKRVASRPLEKRAASSSLDEREKTWSHSGHQRWVLKERPQEKETVNVVVDWYNTIYVGKSIPQRSAGALWKLHNQGAVHMLSFAGFERELEVRDHIEEMVFPFASVNFVHEKAGQGGKAEFCVNKGWKIIFGDSMSVLTDCKRNKIFCYCIKTWANKSWKHSRYDDLLDAVDDFVENHLGKT